MGFCLARPTYIYLDAGLEVVFLGMVEPATGDLCQGEIPLAASSTNTWVNQPLFPYYNWIDTEAI